VDVVPTRKSDGGPGGELTVGSGATETSADDCDARSLPRRPAFGITRVQGLCLNPRGAPTQCSPTLGLGVPARCQVPWRPHSFSVLALCQRPHSQHAQRPTRRKSVWPQQIFHGGSRIRATSTSQISK